MTFTAHCLISISQSNGSRTCEKELYIQVQQCDINIP